MCIEELSMHTRNVQGRIPETIAAACLIDLCRMQTRQARSDMSLTHKDTNQHFLHICTQ
jgi:hypothetical protein